MINFVRSKEFPCRDASVSAQNRAAIHVAGQLAGDLDAVDPKTGAVDWDKVEKASAMATRFALADADGPYTLASESLQPNHPNNPAALTCALRREIGDCLGQCALDSM